MLSCPNNVQNMFSVAPTCHDATFVVACTDIGTVVQIKTNQPLWSSAQVVQIKTNQPLWSSAHA